LATSEAVRNAAVRVGREVAAEQGVSVAIELIQRDASLLA